ncbi:mechanosensitive ion channel family protein [Candidatus Methylospira mobilis]|uniref:mechanosensitive ion channel family protein n=1 Tax=Candidatus Methylospira mobilis TaxID=1808979 RepID=UPI0028EBA39E|nr:mechanosensitive ion channel family protein [Candidatus Methylospira mobilis]WNV03924.1 mechanosensitive ion channel family protein [Candidatus Methylospira mobilis]
MIQTELSIFASKRRLAALLLALSVLQWAGGGANADEATPLRPIDTTSPRATLHGFVKAMSEGYTNGIGVLQSYQDSPRLYFSQEELAVMRDSFNMVDDAERTLDLSELPQATVRETSRGLAIQLKEILDRMSIPPSELIPDAQTMSSAEFKRWTLPDSEIRIARVEKGPRAGEYLFSPETVRRIPEFYQKIKDMPYKPGASAGWYDFASYSPSGVALVLRRVVPTRWVLEMAEGSRPVFLDQPLWRWFGILLVLSAGLAVVSLCFRLSSRWARKKTTTAGRWAHLLQPLSLVIVMPVVTSIFAEVLRVSGVVYQIMSLSLWGLFFLALTWAVWVAGGAVAESIIAHERLRTGSIDSQLIRIALRLVTIVLAIAILVTGADRLGLPAYSVLAGLGIGGLAVALAAQETLANLLGSLIIMFEKPFVIGHWVKVNNIEGNVEDVGFRSTRIRTFYDSVVTIPSSKIVGSTVDNLGLRKFRRVKTVLNLTYDTSAEKMESFVEGVKRIIATHPETRKDKIEVVFNNFGPSSLDILVYFFLKVPDWSAELNQQQGIFIDILRLADAIGVRFAFPTQTLHIVTDETH